MAKHSKSFKNVLRGQIEKHRSKKVDVAAGVGISRSQLDKYLDPDDVTSPNLETLARLAKYFDIPLAEFLEETPRETGNAELIEAMAKLQSRIDQLESALNHPLVTKLVAVLATLDKDKDGLEYLTIKNAIESVLESKALEQSTNPKTKPGKGRT
jgi:transcriptional regulator with XRE-family HTH domain